MSVISMDALPRLMALICRRQTTHATQPGPPVHLATICRRRRRSRPTRRAATRIAAVLRACSPTMQIRRMPRQTRNRQAIRADRRRIHNRPTAIHRRRAVCPPRRRRLPNQLARRRSHRESHRPARTQREQKQVKIESAAASRRRATPMAVRSRRKCLPKRLKTLPGRENKLRLRPWRRISRRLLGRQPARRRQSVRQPPRLLFRMRRRLPYPLPCGRPLRRRPIRPVQPSRRVPLG